MRAVDKLDKLSEEQVRAQLVEDAGLTAEQADSCLALARISTPDTSFVEQVRALGVRHELLDEGLDRARRRHRGLRRPGHRPRRDRRRPEDRPRARLLHRHRLRDPAGGLRGPRLDLLRWAVRRPRHRRPHHLPRSGHLARRQPGARARCSARASSAPTARCPAPCSSPSSTRRAGRPATRSPSSCAATACPARSPPPPRSSASRSGTPSAGASPTFSSRAPTASRRDQGHPQRRPDPVDVSHLDASRRGPAAPHQHHTSHEEQQP